MHHSMHHRAPISIDICLPARSVSAFYQLNADGQVSSVFSGAVRRRYFFFDCAAKSLRQTEFMFSWE